MKKDLKRKFTAMQAVFQVLVLIAFSSISGFSASAEDAGATELPTYTIYRTDGLTLDGKTEGDDWDYVQWSSDFTQFYSNAQETEPDFGAKFKAMWNYDNGEGYLYLLIEVRDSSTESSTAWTKDGFIFAIDETGEATAETAIVSESTTSTCRRTATMGTRSPSTSNLLEYQVAASDSGYVVEAVYRFVDSSYAKAGQIRMDVVAQNECAGGTVMQYSWSGVNYGSGGTFNPQVGVGILSEQTAAGQAQGGEVDPDADVLFRVGEETVASMDAVDGTVTLPEWDSRSAFVGWLDESGEHLYPAGYVFAVGDTDTQTVFTAATLELYLQAGASVLIEEPSAIRFTAVYDEAELESLEAFVTGAGGLAVAESLLTDAILADGYITGEELDAAGVAYETVALEEAEGENMFRLILDEITDTSAVWAAGAYITVRYSDEANTERRFYTGYTAEDNARSVAQVAEAAFADRSNVGAELNGIHYAFRVSSDYAVGDYAAFSFSPYTSAQLDLLRRFTGG